MVEDGGNKMIRLFSLDLLEEIVAFLQGPLLYAFLKIQRVVDFLPRSGIVQFVEQVRESRLVKVDEVYSALRTALERNTEQQRRRRHIALAPEVHETVVERDRKRTYDSQELLVTIAGLFLGPEHRGQYESKHDESGKRGAEDDRSENTDFYEGSTAPARLASFRRLGLLYFVSQNSGPR